MIVLHAIASVILYILYGLCFWVGWCNVITNPPKRFNQATWDHITGLTVAFLVGRVLSFLLTA